MYLVVGMVFLNVLVAAALTPHGLPTFDDIMKGMHEDIRKERGFERDCLYKINDQTLYHFIVSVDGDRVRSRVWSGDTLVVEAGRDDSRSFTISYADKVYLDYPIKNLDFTLPYKRTEVKESDDNQLYMAAKDSYDILIVAEPNPVVLSVADATYNGSPARLALVEFGQPAKRSQLKLYFERGRWILLDAAASDLGDKKQSMELSCKITRGKSFAPSDFILNPTSVVGFTKKEPDGKG